MIPDKLDKAIGVFLDVASVDRGDLDLSCLTNTGLDWTLHDATKPNDTAGRVNNAQVVVSNKAVLDRSTLGSAQSLRLVCIAATGTNNIDLDAAREFGISVSNVTGYASPSVAQHVFALILALATRLPDYQRLIADGRWQSSEHFCLLDFPIWKLQGKTLGIVGYGELGRAVARIAEAFGMQTLVSKRPAGAESSGRVPLDELLAAVDVLSLHCPLTESTRNLIGARELAMMKPTALLINTARGGIVDEQALAEALEGGPDRWRGRRRAHQRTAQTGQPPAQPGYPQPDRHTSHRLGEPRDPPAPDRGGREEHRSVHAG